MDRCGPMCDTDIQSQPESRWSLERTLWGRPSSSAGLSPSLGRGRQGCSGSRPWAVQPPKSSLVSAKGLGGRSRVGWCLACSALCCRLGPPTHVPLFNPTTSCFSLPLINAGLLPSCYSPSISLATRPFIKVIAMNAESLGFTVAI